MARQTWYKTSLNSDGLVIDVSPEPGRTYTRYTWPPRGRGRGESLYSPRRIAAKLRAIQVIQLRRDGLTWHAIANLLNFRCPSGAYRAYKRAVDRCDWDRDRKTALQCPINR